MSFVFNMLTVYVNLFNWVFQILTVNERISSSTLQKRLPWTVFIALFSFFIIIYLSYLFVGCKSEDAERKASNVASHIFGVAYIIIGIAFIIMGRKFISKLHLINPEFVHKISRIVKINVVIIGSIFIFRGLLLIARTIWDLDNKFKHYDQTNSGYLYPTYYFLYWLVCSIIPACLHILMLRNLPSCHKSLNEQSESKVDTWSFHSGHNQVLLNQTEGNSQLSSTFNSKATFKYVKLP